MLEIPGSKKTVMNWDVNLQREKVIKVTVSALTWAISEPEYWEAKLL